MTGFIIKKFVDNNKMLLKIKNKINFPKPKKKIIEIKIKILKILFIFFLLI